MAGYLTKPINCANLAAQIISSMTGSSISALFALLVHGSTQLIKNASHAQVNSVYLAAIIQPLSPSNAITASLVMILTPLRNNVTFNVILTSSGVGIRIRVIPALQISTLTLTPINVLNVL